MSEEIKPLEESGSVEVSPAVSGKTIKCKICGVDVVRKGKATKYCEKCSSSRVKVHQQNRITKKKATNMQAASTVEVKPKDAKKILEDRGLRHPRAVEVCLQLAEVAARNLRIPFNAHLLKHGVQSTLAKLNGETFEPPVVEDVWKIENQSPMRELELRTIYDFSCSWRTQKDGTKLTYDQWMKLRGTSLTDLFHFGKDIIGLDLHDEPHGRWCREMFVQKKYLLPEQYDWEDVKVALAAQSDIHQRMLASSRSSYKSSVNLVDLLQWVLAFNGDIRIFIVSSTSPLSAGFLRKFRSYFTVRNENEPTLFNQLFPEHMLASNDSGPSKNFVSPLRRLDLIQATLTSAALNSEGLAGERMDVYVAEDIAEISNSNNPEMRAGTLEKFDMLKELLEPFGFLQIVCTPFASGKGTEEDPGDVYSVLLRREQRHIKSGGDPRLVSIICPAWTVKSGIKKLPYDPSLSESDVELLFPSRLSFKYLMAKLRENLTTDRTAKIFRQQSLCQWCPDEDETLRVTFDRADLDDRVRSASYFEFNSSAAQKILGLDRAYSISKYADRSCLLLASKQPVRQKDGNYKQALVFTDCRTERWRESDLIRNICEMIERHRPHVFVAEQDKNWQEVWDQVRLFCINRGIPAPHFLWKTIVTTDKAFARRAKQMEAPIFDGRIWWVDADWTEGVLKEFENFDGIHSSNSHRKDDAVACASLIHQECGVKYREEVKPEDAEQKRREAEEEWERSKTKGLHDRMFGQSFTPPKPLEPQPQQPPVGRSTPFPRGGNFASLPSAFRTTRTR
jgi:hypothetical protein